MELALGVRVIDTVHVRIPSGTAFSPVMESTVRGLRSGPMAPFRPSRFYTYVGDLRKAYKLDAILHLEYKLGECTHKIEILDAGKKSLTEMEGIIRSIVDVDPRTLALMRADFAADVKDVPVPWFRKSALFRHKRFSSHIDKAEESELEFIGMGTAKSQSLYAGRRPNCVRVYDKVAELRQQWLTLKRNCERFNRQLKDFELTEEQRNSARRIPPTFQEFCLMEGFEYTEGGILTRIERQIGGDRFPNEMRTFGDLYNADRFDPFKDIRFMSSSPIRSLDSVPTGVPVRDWLAACGLQALIDHFGSAQLAYGFVSKNAKGNGKRILENLASIMPHECASVTRSEVLEVYKQSTKKQIEGRTGSGVYLPPTYEQTETPGRSTELLPQTGPDRWQSTSGKTDAGAA